jgi:hypothetical protein
MGSLWAKFELREERRGSAGVKLESKVAGKNIGGQPYLAKG